MTTDRRGASPVGDTAAVSARRRAGASAEYRAQSERLEPYRVIARAVILARADLGLTQDVLAKRIGTTKSAVSRIESGRHPISYETLAKLGAALDITFSVGSTRAAGRGSVIVPGPVIAAGGATRSI